MQGHNQIRALVDRIERLEDDKIGLNAEIKIIYREAKDHGLDVKALRALIARRKKDQVKLAEHEALVETYMHALGMLADTPLGQAAIDRDVPSMAEL